MDRRGHHRHRRVHRVGLDARRRPQGARGRPEGEVLTPATGRFVAFEGGDAAGKSTQARRLAARLDALLTFEPGDTPSVRAIRSILLDPSTGDLDHRTEALLMAADRAEHVASVVRPALEAGRHVVTDRYLYSSVAYQAHGRGLDPAAVRDLSLWATDGLEPDLVVLLDLPVDVARARVAHVAPDRLEAEDEAFHERVRAGYHAQVGADPDRWLVLDARDSVDSLAAVIWATVEPLLRQEAGWGSERAHPRRPR